MISQHPDSETLLRLMDEELAPAEASAMQRHLSSCGDCREKFGQIEEALDDYARFHREVLKPSLPEPPAPWAELEFPAARGASRRPWYWLAAAAAAIAVVFALARRFESVPSVSAAELLRQAAAAEQGTPNVRARVRIRRGSSMVLRAAHAGGEESVDTAAIHALFDTAGYRWDDPLSVSAFTDWRGRQPQIQDQAARQGDAWLVRTASSSGALSEAELTLRASDLHPIACSLRLRSSGETIEMTEAPPEAARPSVPGPISAPVPSAASQAAAPATPGDELRVIAALHAIGADLGEPIEVRREGARVTVIVTGLDAARREQIRAAVSQIPVADLRFEEIRSGAVPSPAPAAPAAAPAQRTNPLIAPELADPLIDATDKASARAFALRSLARRFSPELEAQLSPADDGVLKTIVRDHAAALSDSIGDIRRLLAAILPSVPAVPALSGAWQTIAEPLPAEIEQLDRATNGATDATSARKSQIAAGIVSIQAALEGLNRQ